jgi:hypothetical protein
VFTANDLVGTTTIDLEDRWVRCCSWLWSEPFSLQGITFGSDVNSFCCYGLVYLLDSW